MPVFVEWKWEEQTRSFLVIFHLYDDFSKPNLRLEPEKSKVLLFSPKFGMKESISAWMTWAPSHPELALLTEILSYANIINGLNEIKRRDLRRHLEMFVNVGGRVARYNERILFDTVNRKLGGKSFLFGVEPKGKSRFMFCSQLCPEYIEYLKNILKSYLK